MVGHVTIDRVNGTERVGGAAAYASLTARHLGVHAAVVTSAGADFPYWDLFSGIESHTVASESTTVFVNSYRDGARTQHIGALASPIRAEHLTGLHLAENAAVLYCPVVHEVEAPLTRLTSKGLCGVAPQGFYRRWDDTGRVERRDWDQAADRLKEVDFVCLSERDAEVPEEIAEGFPGLAFVVTRGENGCRVYSGVDVYDFPAVPVPEVDPTGAGDVFAAAFLVALRAGKAVPHAVQLATRTASMAVAAEGVSGLI